MLDHSLDEFFDTGRYLMIGALLSASIANVLTDKMDTNFGLYEITRYFCDDNFSCYFYRYVPKQMHLSVQVY